MFKKWIIENVSDFNNKIKNEEDLKIKVLIPYLKFLGYEDEDMRFENAIPVRIGTKKTVVFSDIEILINDRVEIVIDAKNPINSITEKDVLQSESYAKLVSTPTALYGITTNGIECISTNVHTGQRNSIIPTKAKLLSDLNNARKKIFQDIELREIHSILYTLSNPKELYAVIKSCKDVIEKMGLIRSDQSFKEMTKILLIKMNEERRVKDNEGENRFSLDYITAASKVNKCLERDVIIRLFEESKLKFPNIYTNNNEEILIQDNQCLVNVTSKLEPFSFIGTGDDVKGTVYEIFLKATLRGEFDQYFTPRELVDFIVKFSDPAVGDVMLDPACGSGGFLIQAFNYVNRKIIDSPDSNIKRNEKFTKLVDKCLWGHEADYDLHVLAKINLIMHGDGWNNIYQGDTLSSDNLPENYFDLILMNPPFTIPYTNSTVLGQYELGLGKEREELDILFVEKSLKLLKPGSDMYIILPEGLMNIKKYQFFREWILDNAYVLLSISLPEGAFIPFGGSVSKTCIIGLRKKDVKNLNNNKPNHVFLGRAIEVGYELGKKSYIAKRKNDLTEFNYYSNEVFERVITTSNNGECGWIKQDLINSERMDANYLLNKIDREELKDSFEKLVSLASVCDIENISITVNDDDTTYDYLEVPDISPDTGAITNIRKVKGSSISNSFHKFYPGDILYSRINPRKNRVAIAPPISDFGIVSKEVYRIVYKENPYIKFENRYVIKEILQSEHVKNQLVRLSTGSSSSRARVQVNDFLKDVYIPIPEENIQKKISKETYDNSVALWNLTQKYLNSFTNNQNALGSDLDKNDFRTV